MTREHSHTDAITLVWGLAQGSLLLDLMWAWGRAAWERERPSSPPAQLLATRNAKALSKDERGSETEFVRDVVQM